MVKILNTNSRNLFLLLLGSILYNCNIYAQILKDDKLSLIKQVYAGTQLRIDGYYYLMDKSSNTIIATYLFYNNGILLHGGGWPYSNQFEGLNNNFCSEIWSKVIKEYKDNWGLFAIEGNKIVFERWYPSSGGPYPAYIRSGEILNDTTFIITQSMRSNGKEVSEENEVYHFKQFSPKPDSTNNFVK